METEGPEEKCPEEVNCENRCCHRKELRSRQHPTSNQDDNARSDGRNREKHRGLHEMVEQVAFRSD